jgi:hypothetical protein
MEQVDKNQIVIAAVGAAGPVGDDRAAWSDRVVEMAAQITAMSSPNSDVMTTIDSVSNAKVFTATLLEIKKEQSSTRGLLTLKTRVSEHSPDGTEQARTERTDTRQGIAMARRCRALVGHRVAVWVEVQTMKNSTNKVRVIAHIEDLGEAEEGGDSV